jgi:hypothetical protein
MSASGDHELDVSQEFVDIGPVIRNHIWQRWRGGAGSRVAPVSRSCAWRCRMLGPRVYSSRYSLAAAWRAPANFGSNWTAASRMAARPGGSGHATSSPSAFWAASAPDIRRRSTCNRNRSRRAQSSRCRSAWPAAMAKRLIARYARTPGDYQLAPADACADAQATEQLMSVAGQWEQAGYPATAPTVPEPKPRLRHMPPL